MKRIIGSVAALALALSLGVAAYGKVPKQNQPAQTTPTKPMKKTHKKKKHTGHHKGHSKHTTPKSTPTPKK